jgi:DNA-binding response OmpR family regulator
VKGLNPSWGLRDMASRILIVEDLPEWQAIFVNALAGGDYYIERVDSFTRALHILQVAAPFRVVIVDVWLGNTNHAKGGRALAGYLSKLLPKTRTIVVSGDPRTTLTDVRDFLIDFRADDFISKVEFSPHQFKGKVDMAICRSMHAEEGQRTMEPNTFQKLIEIHAQIQGNEEALAQLERKWRSGDIDNAQYIRLVASRRTEVHTLISEVQLILTGTEAEIIGDLLERVKANESPEQIQKELKEAVERKGWGKAILDQIDKYKGEIATLLTAIAIEIVKRTVSGQ